jgi:hypothetical protein
MRFKVCAFEMGPDRSVDSKGELPRVCKRCGPILANQNSDLITTMRHEIIGLHLVRNEVVRSFGDLNRS